VINRDGQQFITTGKHPALREYPSKLFVETTSRCNLNCFMCVKQTRGSGLTEGDLSLETFKWLEPALPNLDSLILSGVGEPLLHPQLETFIRRGKELMPATGLVGFQSNGLLLNKRRALSLVEAGLDRICISLDANSTEIFRKVREGGELDAVDRALEALDSAGSHDRAKSLQVGVEFVLMRDNLHELPAALRWAARRGASFAIVSHVLPYDGAHASQAAYQTCTEGAVALFDEWHQTAAKSEVAIEQYFHVLWRYAKNEEEQRIIDTVEAMKSEAKRRGIAFDLRKLLNLDRTLRQQVAAVFEEAREVARATGLELSLPAIAPKDDRQCHFVEEGGAFVSWAGAVHPCYFLWHRYNCFASGWDQAVQPKVFGQLAERDILEIWNDAGFRTFRENVIRYDYPHCTSCSLAPCDYVQTESFEQNCQVGKEPCGSCLWCMGLFQCLR
jgi:putative metalloenzyme radical SAM/SPASM domain maturase